MKQKSAFRSAPALRRFGEGGLFRSRAWVAFLLCAAAFSIATRTLLGFFHAETPPSIFKRSLTFEDRVTYQHAIEEVYWRHRIWPKENPVPKPSLDAVMPQTQLEKKVEDYLRKSQALEDYWQRPITSEQLQAVKGKRPAGATVSDKGQTSRLQGKFAQDLCQLLLVTWQPEKDFGQILAHVRA